VVLLPERIAAAPSQFGSRKIFPGEPVHKLFGSCAPLLSSRLRRRGRKTEETSTRVLVLVLLNRYVMASQMTVLAISTDGCFQFAAFSANNPITDAKASLQRRIYA
jgi:hypothetical protein